MAEHAHTVTLDSGRDILAEFYRCPEGAVQLPHACKPLADPGFFRFGQHAIGYGSTARSCPPRVDGDLPDLLETLLDRGGSALSLPFDPAEVLDNLRMERYPQGTQSVLSSKRLSEIYYAVRPLLGDHFRNKLQRLYFRGWENIRFPAWPLDTSVEHFHAELLRIGMKLQGVIRVPFIWFWPDGAKAAAIMTHDVETEIGRDFIPRLLEVDAEAGIKASYQLVPEQRYEVPAALRDLIRSYGCEVNIHDLTHAGNLFDNREHFRQQAQRINHYARAFGSEGFRAACMYRNAEWLSDLAVDYDMSVPNSARLEPQRGGCCTVFPFFIGDIVELPLTMIQDFSLFNMLRTYSSDLWEEQVELVLGQHGLMSFIVHPDYILDETALQAYQKLLRRLVELKETRGVWLAKPGEVARWWRERNSMRVVAEGSGYRIDGPGSERARIAYAHLDGDRISYEFA